MLLKLLVASRAEILVRSHRKLAARHVPPAPEGETMNGLPGFLDQLITVLGQSKGDRAAGHLDIAARAATRGGELLGMGFTVGQVVQDYGSLCQSVTELASEQDVSITADDFQTFNRCLDDAIAQAVTEYEHQRDQKLGGSGTEQLGSLAHEMRNMVTTAMLTFDVLQGGIVGVHGRTSALLGNSLRRMSGLLDRTILDVRSKSGKMRAERVSVEEVLEELRVVATIEATDRKLGLQIDAGDAGPLGAHVLVDRQMLVSAVANLLQNAFKFTRAAGSVSIRAHVSGARILIDVEDECGGLPAGAVEDLFLPFEQRGGDQTGLGLGLSISQKAMRASGGEIRVRDQPGRGCVFTIDLPSAPAAPAPPPS